MADKGVVRAEGHNGQIEFDGSHVLIERNGWRGRLGHGAGPSSVSLADVQRLDFELPSAFSKGYARFAVPGHIDNQVENDRYCVLFTKKQAADFVVLRDAVKAALSSRTDAEREALRARSSESYSSMRRSPEPTFGATAGYGQHRVQGDVYMYPTSSGNTAHKTLTGARAEFEHGADKSRPTLTRIGAGAIIAGPAGAVVGGLFKKDRTKCYVTVAFADGDTAILEGPSKDERKLREFAASINRLAT